ncbi:cellulose biosynthesis cyclic di-GMP-binding regulatory protein BcsB [Igneacidithiobacillus siniensis]|uniref:cellulose biosynthesis cyclic di-GMP-binding regulatory protein BcsB n=1 Tax=Acidithiobacillus TaxID=119977 RepID=UPI00200CAADC|nr:cellulose biosynthesis cyclic di-GMP-binding regulatory protein BcsB [Acidithiobacillus sp. S30A2]
MTDCESAGRNAGFLWRWLGLIFCFSLLLPGVVHADTPVRHSLAELIQGSQYAQISAQSPRLEIPWTVPKQQEADQALLHLFYFVSPGTAPGTELVVSLDGRDVGAVQESPKYPEGQAVIRLANHAIAAGGHEVEIQLKLAHPDAAKSNAWTQLDLYRSSLGYQAHHLPWQKVDFADFDDMLRDASQSGAWTLPLELDGAPTPQILTAAQQVVAGIALRAQAPVLVHVQQTTASGAGKTALQNSHAPMTVVIGTEEELSGSYGKLGQFNGPVMLLQRSAAGDGGVDLVITGPTPADVLQAARTFASNREAVPVGNVWQVPKSLAPTQAHFDRVQNPPALQPGMEVPIRSAHSQDVDGEILAGKMIHFSFWMPGGQFADRQAQMVMKLNLDVTPDKKTTRRPLITILANGQWISQWHLGLGAAHYETRVPFSTLAAGMNHINLEITGATASLLAGSTLRIPPTHDYAMLPDLRLFARTGFPLVRTGGEKLSLIYLDPSPQEESAGLTLFARLAQAARSNLPDAIAQIDGVHAGTNEIIFATQSHLSQSALAGAPVQLLANGLRWQLAGSDKSPWSGEQGLQPAAFLMESRNGASDHWWKLIFTAGDAADFETASYQLVKEKNWDGLRGDFAWIDQQGRYQSTLFGRQQIYGRRNSPWYWIYLFSIRPYWWILIALLLVAGGTASGWVIIQKKRRRWRMEETHEQST